MVMSNTERVGKALDLLRSGMRLKCEQTWKGFYGDGWLQLVNSRLRNQAHTPDPNDIQFLFNAMKATWTELFGHGFGPSVRSLVFELSDVRNKWAHQGAFTSDDVLRALDSMERLLDEFGDSERQREIKTLRVELMRQVFEEQTRGERRKRAARSTEGQPHAGLTPWREIISPHADVREGRFNQAEFAADLHQVAQGTADDEYQNPKAFFSRTYLTQGLRDLLVGTARRLSGGDGDPVLQLQTNFGGGKTHSMIALYHLASGAPATDLPGVSEALAEENVTLPDGINRAVIVGPKISPQAPHQVEDGIAINTLWGQIAYQLGGAAGYELVRTDDEHGTNPGHALMTLFQQFGPALVLIDEWVAYARQLSDGASGQRFSGGDFDTQFTFAQLLTEAAAAVPNVVVLVSLPESDIEVGGDRGRTALTRLKNVVGRTAAQWQPATPDESFEIVRRRLFDPLHPDNFRVRDGVIDAFIAMYRNNKGEFSAGVSENTYRKRMELSYPIHPELFDRLFGEWSTLDRFQRTRGVLRLMAYAISQLWQRGDTSLLIMPGTLPLDSAVLVAEFRRYLEDGWDPVIKSDVDGENALPIRIDSEKRYFAQISATRRAARTVFLGSAAKPVASRGVDLKRVVLGCAQPGEQIGQFAGALRQLSGEATHLYVDGAQYWYSLQPNVNRVAADRAESNYTTRDADDEVRRRLTRRGGRGVFAAVQIFAEGPGDVPDDDDGVRLVVLTPDVAHSLNDMHSSAITRAEEILNQRDAGPRLNRNLVVFVAAADNRLRELRPATRGYLAWCSIRDDALKLDLTEHQKRQVETKITETDRQVDSLIGETFIHVLAPSQKPGTKEIDWQTLKAPPQGEIAERVGRKLRSEEKLIDAYGGVRVRMDLDTRNLWSDRHDISVGDLWAVYARYPYMPRLASLEVLQDAVSNGTANINWREETFGYGEAHDGKKWVGIKTAEHVRASVGGLLLHPDHLVVPETLRTIDPSDPNVKPISPNHIRQDDNAGNDRPASPRKTHYRAQFDLDPLRGINGLSEVMTHVLNHLGDDVKLSLEVEACSEDGFDETTRRVVSENAEGLDVKFQEFD